MQKICWILSVNRDGATLFVGSPANAGPWLFSNKEQQNIKAFFQPTYEIDFISYDVLQRKYQKLRSFCTMKCSLPIFPKNHQSWSADCLCGYRYKNYEQFKKLWLLNLQE